MPGQRCSGGIQHPELSPLLPGLIASVRAHLRRQRSRCVLEQLRSIGCASGVAGSPAESARPLHAQLCTLPASAWGKHSTHTPIGDAGQPLWLSCIPNGLQKLCDSHHSAVSYIKNSQHVRHPSSSTFTSAAGISGVAWVLQLGSLKVRPTERPLWTTAGVGYG